MRLIDDSGHNLYADPTRMNHQKIVFEPWSLGDVLIVATVVSTLPITEVTIACSRRWIPLLEAAWEKKKIKSPLSTVAIDLDYTTHHRFYKIFGIKCREDRSRSGDVVISVRGDPRDFIAALLLFPKATYRFSGWLRFLLRRSGALSTFLLNLFPTLKVRMVRNRYHQWGDALGCDLESLDQRVFPKFSDAQNQRILIHVGAQWGSKRYPHFNDLTAFLKSKGHSVNIVGGPGDSKQFSDLGVKEMKDAELVEAIVQSHVLICCDSAPLHLAAFLSHPAIPLFHVTNPTEWCPPGYPKIASPDCPNGLEAKRGYAQNEPLPGWTDAKEVCERISLILSGRRD